MTFERVRCGLPIAAVTDADICVLGCRMAAIDQDSLEAPRLADQLTGSAEEFASGCVHVY